MNIKVINNYRHPSGITYKKAYCLIENGRIVVAEPDKKLFDKIIAGVVKCGG